MHGVRPAVAIVAELTEVQGDSSATLWTWFQRVEGGFAVVQCQHSSRPLNRSHSVLG